MLYINKVSKHYGEKIVLDDVNLTIYDGEKIGIIGSNGQGKSTLLNIIAGSILPDGGNIITNEKIGYLKQSSQIEDKELKQTLLDVENSSDFLYYLSQFNISTDLDLNNLENISCGEKTKIALSIILSNHPTLLILDEPTNHLDIAGKNLLIKLLNGLEQTVLVVSHDIDFLNKTIYKILEIKNGKINEYFGNYDNYLEQSTTKRLTIQRQYEKQQKEARGIQEDIEAYKKASLESGKKKRKNCAGRWSPLRQDVAEKKLSKFAKTKIKQLEHKLNEDIPKPEKEHKIKYFLKTDEIKAKNIVIAEGLTKKYGNRVIFENANFLINAKDKIGIIGNNGVGKTTLINIITGKTDYLGKLFVTPSLKISVLKQDIYDLDETKTINELSQEKDPEYRTDFISNLIGMNIDKTRFNTLIKNLSSGEKMRIKLTQLILSDTNFIILDEPTNHLDIENKNYLKTVLEGFLGTVLIISHDLEFLKHTTSKTLKIENQKITLN